MPDTDAKMRRQQLLASFPTLKLDAAVVVSQVNVRYLTGFTGSNGVLVLTPKTSILFTDPRYDTQSREESDTRVSVSKNPLLPLAAAVLTRAKARRIGFENARMTVSQAQMLEKELPASAALAPLNNAIEALRMVKSESEVNAIRSSVLLNSRAYEKAIGRWKPSMTESDLAAELEYQMRRLGAEKPSFETIVASGPRTALPHASPTTRKLDGNQLLLIDMGAYLHGYASDMTRMAHIGAPPAKTKRLYQAVLEAQLAAVEAIRPGALAKSIDQSARRVLKQHGMDRAFIHSTGHGLGLEIHESPRLGRNDKTRLAPGMVITIEPGAYWEGQGGVRIEDTVLVTEKGHEVLTPTPKELRAL